VISLISESLIVCRRLLGLGVMLAKTEKARLSFEKPGPVVHSRKHANAGAAS